MAIIENEPRASGGPGIEPRWTHSAKDVVGTAYSTASPIWFTASGGVLNEIYYPTIDRPQIRDLQYLVTDGETFFHDVHRNQDTSIEYLGDRGLGVRIINADREGRYRVVMEIITDPHQPCLLVDTRLEGDADLLRRLRLFVLLSPHLNVGGWGNSANVARMAGYEFLTAHKDNTWLALGANVPFVRRSCGYVGKTDGWQDLNHNFELDWQFASAPDGNVALTAEIALPEDYRFTLGLAFGNGLHRAVTCLYQSLGVPFAQHSARFLEQWTRACLHMYPLERWTGDGGHLCHRTRELLLAHEDKRFSGALIASLSIPWGESQGRRRPRRLSSGMDSRHGQQRDRAARRRRPCDSGARAHLPRVLAAARRRLPAEFLDRRHALLAGHPARRSRLSDHAGVPAGACRRDDGSWIRTRWCWRPRAT